MKILLSISNELIRKGISAFIQEELDVEEFHEVLVYNNFRAVLKDVDFDLVVLDANLLEKWGMKVIEELRFINLKTKVLVFTSGNEISLVNLLNLGADGFCLFDVSAAEFKNALSIITKGGIYISDELKYYIVNKYYLNEKGEAGLHLLTKREAEVYGYLIKGVNTGEISKLMEIKMSTVSTFKSHIFKKCMVTNVVELIHKAEKFENK